jgi:hypothetical protein
LRYDACIRESVPEEIQDLNFGVQNVQLFAGQENEFLILILESSPPAAASGRRVTSDKLVLCVLQKSVPVRPPYNNGQCNDMVR